MTQTPNKKSKPSVRDRIENHIPTVVLGATILGFGGGITAVETWKSVSEKVLISESKRDELLRIEGDYISLEKETEEYLSDRDSVVSRNETLQEDLRIELAKTNSLKKSNEVLQTDTIPNLKSQISELQTKLNYSSGEIRSLIDKYEELNEIAVPMLEGDLQERDRIISGLNLQIKEIAKRQDTYKIERCGNWVEKSWKTNDVKDSNWESEIVSWVNDVRPLPEHLKAAVAQIHISGGYFHVFTCSEKNGVGPRWKLQAVAPSKDVESFTNPSVVPIGHMTGRRGVRYFYFFEPIEPTQKDVTPIYDSCADVISKFPNAISDAYLIDLDGKGPLEPTQIYCESQIEDGGWALFAHHADAKKSISELEYVSPDSVSLGVVKQSVWLELLENMSTGMMFIDEVGRVSTVPANKLLAANCKNIAENKTLKSTRAGDTYFWHQEPDSCNTDNQNYSLITLAVDGYKNYEEAGAALWDFDQKFTRWAYKNKFSHSEQNTLKYFIK